MFNKSEPLGLPRGSGRLIIALMVTATFCATFLTGRELDPALLTMMGVVLTFYFTQRAKETADRPIEEELPEPLV
jgi:uncharacterized membrane protein (UPF0136 family)